MSDSELGRPNGDGAPSPQEFRVQILNQYVKDLSFENPAAGSPPQVPQIELGVDLQARRLDNERFEVELKLRVTAKAEEKPAKREKAAEKAKPIAAEPLPNRSIPRPPVSPEAERLTKMAASLQQQQDSLGNRETQLRDRSKQLEGFLPPLAMQAG